MVDREKFDSGGKLLPICSICQRVPAAGIFGGMKINRWFICQSCEMEIVNLNVETAYYVKIMNKIKAVIK